MCVSVKSSLYAHARNVFGYDAVLAYIVYFADIYHIEIYSRVDTTARNNVYSRVLVRCACAWHDLNSKMVLWCEPSETDRKIL